MKKEILEAKVKADSITFLVKQIEWLESKQRKINNCKVEMANSKLYSDRQFDILENELSDCNRQIEQYESQIKAL